MASKRKAPSHMRTYDVEKLIDCRLDKGRLHYLVAWVGYGARRCQSRKVSDTSFKF